MKRLRTAVIAFTVCMLTVPVLLASETAGAAPRTALVNASTVSGSPSQEEKIATVLGYTVTKVSDAAWGAMTTAQFASYDLLIAGDPTCGSVPPGFIASAPAFGPAVMGTGGGRTTAGNRVLVGTDPVFHDGGDYTSPGARGTIIREGIAFAGAHVGTTGLYFDSTCGSPAGGLLSVLNQIKAGTGAWTINEAPPCGGSVSLIAAHPSFTDLSTASLEGWNCSVHQSFPTFPSDWSALAVATDTPTKPTCGVDPDTTLSACGQAYILIAGAGIVVESGAISLTPLTSTNPVGTSHKVTANVHTSGGTPIANQLVTFSVTGQNAGASGVCLPASCKSDASGNVSFTYVGANGVGSDTIKASFTDALGSLQSATAQKNWVAATDSTKPSCALTAVVNGPPKAIKVTVQDTGSGLASIVGSKLINTSLTVPAFATGSKSALVVTGTKVNQAAASQLELTVKDVAGNTTVCDPVFVTLNGPLAYQAIPDVPQAEHLVTVRNGTPGLKTLVVVANGKWFTARLAPGRESTINIASALKPGDANKLIVVGLGTKRGKADVIIWDGVGTI